MFKVWSLVKVRKTSSTRSSVWHVTVNEEFCTLGTRLNEVEQDYINVVDLYIKTRIITLNFSTFLDDLPGGFGNLYSIVSDHC